MVLEWYFSSYGWVFIARIFLSLFLTILVNQVAFKVDFDPIFLKLLRIHLGLDLV